MSLFRPPPPTRRWHLSQVSLCILTPARQLNTNADLGSEGCRLQVTSSIRRENINPFVHKWPTILYSPLADESPASERASQCKPTNQSSLLRHVILKMLGLILKKKNETGIYFTVKLQTKYIFSKTLTNHLKTKKQSLFCLR